ncbi:hypothetical protein ACFCV9_18775 [Streptomyces sp. NPDC056367]
MSSDVNGTSTIGFVPRGGGGEVGTQRSQVGQQAAVAAGQVYMPP